MNTRGKGVDSMDVTPATVYVNLKHWNWEILERYPLQKKEYEAIKPLLEKTVDWSKANGNDVCSGQPRTDV